MVPTKIEIEARGVNGVATATFALAAWLGMNPLQRVLAIHDALRPTLCGQRFDVIRETRS